MAGGIFSCGGGVPVSDVREVGTGGGRAFGSLVEVLKGLLAQKWAETGAGEGFQARTQALRTKISRFLR